MSRLLTAAVTAVCILALLLIGPVQAQTPTPAPTGAAPDGSAGEVDIGRAIVAGRHHTDVGRAAAAVGAPGGFSRVPIEWRSRDGARASRHGGAIALSIYVVAPIHGSHRAGDVLPMHHVGVTSLADRVDFFDIHLGYLEYLIHAALTPTQRAIYKPGTGRYELRFMASTNRAIGTVGVRGQAAGPVVGEHASELRPSGLPPLVMIDEGRAAPARRSHDEPARTICATAFGSAFLPAGLQIRDVFTADPRAELAYVKTSPTSVARIRYSSSDETAVDIGAALWGVNLDFATSKTVARELTHTYTTSTGPNQYRAISTTLYARQYLLRCMWPNPFSPVIELTRPHMYAEYHAEAAEGLVPRGLTPHRWLYSCKGQFATTVGNRNSGGTWAQHRRVSLTYQNAVRLHPGGTTGAIAMDLRQRIGRSDEVTVTYEKVHRGRLSICGYAFKIPSQSSRVRAQGGCNPSPCERVLY
ncbi:MAG: hypothetical protein OES57_08905 [Acidimicrobiia bacterium]|nr:hypothetical protein [Acidimicrobiia bacterium]